MMEPSQLFPVVRLGQVGLLGQLVLHILQLILGPIKQVLLVALEVPVLSELTEHTHLTQLLLALLAEEVSRVAQELLAHQDLRAL
jgi:hypothetical protein